MQYESQIATFLLAHAEGAGRHVAERAAEALRRPASAAARCRHPALDRPAWRTSTRTTDSGALSPVGFVHLFRQYFFDLGTFLGEPVEHVWLAPGTTIELIEVSTRKSHRRAHRGADRSRPARAEHSTAVKDELSDAVKAENSSSTKLGVSTTNTVNYGVYQGTATVSLGLGLRAQGRARDAPRRTSREQAEKLSTEIKASFKSVFKTVTETTDTRSRRYVLQNPARTLVNYELRRKMRRVGVQMQDLGERLCWQVFVDDPARQLGLSELVHFAESPDLSQPQAARRPSACPRRSSRRSSAPIPVHRRCATNDDNGPGADYGNTRPIEAFDGKHQATAPTRTTRTPPTARSSWARSLHVRSAAERLRAHRRPRASARKATSGPSCGRPSASQATGSSSSSWSRVNFGGANEIDLDVEVVFTPQLPGLRRLRGAQAKARSKYDAENSG